jgi:methionine synthase I (cobalamin-dependent)
METPPAPKKAKTRRGLKERLAAGETVLCAEGYLLAFVRAGYVLQGLWVPEFVLDYPEVLRQQHYEFARAGSDVTEAYQYHTHRNRMDLVGMEDKTEQINRMALKIAREVAEDTGTLFAGGVSSTNLFQLRGPDDKDPTEEVRAIFEEQIRWSKEEGVDYIIAETMWGMVEAKIALEVIKSFDLPAVVSFSVHSPKKDGVYYTYEDVPVPEACRQLLELGATLVGVNCSRGPATMIDVVEHICREVPPEKVCALPIMYRTTPEEPTWQVFTDKGCPENNPVYPDGLEPFYISQVEVVQFTKRCLELGLRYFGLCCGNTGSYTRTMAEAMGKDSILSKYHEKVGLAQTKTEEFRTKICKLLDNPAQQNK